MFPDVIAHAVALAMLSVIVGLGLKSMPPLIPGKGNRHRDRSHAAPEG